MTSLYKPLVDSPLNWSDLLHDAHGCWRLSLKICFRKPGHFKVLIYFTWHVVGIKDKICLKNNNNKQTKNNEHNLSALKLLLWNKKHFWTKSHILACCTKKLHCKMCVWMYSWKCSSLQSSLRNFASVGLDLECRH